MGIDKDHIQSQTETGEVAPIDQVEERVEAEMKKLRGEAKKHVADGLQDDELAQEGERLVEEAERELKQKNASD
ncbi:MAG TPA: hypothetical protein VGW76_13690 [Pyrinomonadaceae bacterium]|nr:hypothetical protein [Pyrinomonadaceae bacterium]